MSVAILAQEQLGRTTISVIHKNVGSLVMETTLSDQELALLRVRSQTIVDEICSLRMAGSTLPWVPFKQPPPPRSSSSWLAGASEADVKDGDGEGTEAPLVPSAEFEHQPAAQVEQEDTGAAPVEQPSVPIAASVAGLGPSVARLPPAESSAERHKRWKKGAERAWAAKAAAAVAAGEDPPIQQTGAAKKRRTQKQKATAKMQSAASA